MSDTEAPSVNHKKRLPGDDAVRATRQARQDLLFGRH